MVYEQGGIISQVGKKPEKVKHDAEKAYNEIKAVRVPVIFIIICNIGPIL